MSTHVTLTDTIVTFNIVPVKLTPVMRQHLTRAYDGTPQLTSFANQTYGYEMLVMTAYWNSMTATNYNQCQVWSGAGTSITVTDADTSSEYSVWTGKLLPPEIINSKQKNAGRPVLRLLLSSVTQR